MHVDADAFFATVEQVLNPSLRGKPVLVGGPSDKNGIVCAASYEARKFGVHAGMPMYLAKKNCPQAIVVAANFSAYREFSKKMYCIFANYTPNVEMASIDEAYLDITGCELLHKKSAIALAKEILLRIHKKIGISVSCGLASSKTVAKVLSSTNKPHKFSIVDYGKEEQFLAPLSLRSLPGVGPKTFAMFENAGFYKISDISKLSCNEVLDNFGLNGINLWKRCKGFDNTPVISDHSLPKSISKEHTFYQALRNSDECLSYLRSLCTNVFAKLRSYELKAKTVFVKIRYKIKDGEKYAFRDFIFQQNLELPSSSDKRLFKHIKSLFLANFDANEPVRLLGVGVTKLIQDYNLSLFELDNDEDKLLFEIDRMKKVYGQQSVTYGL